MTVTKDEARWIVHGVESWCQLQQWADDAVYARRALDRLRERVWVRRGSTNVDAGPACTGWERGALERQLLDYVLEYGYVPSADTVRTLRKNASEAKKGRASVAQIRMASELLAA